MYEFHESTGAGRNSTVRERQGGMIKLLDLKLKATSRKASTEHSF